MYYPKYSHFKDEIQTHDLTKLKCSNGKLLIGSFTQPFTHHIEAIVVVSESCLTVIEITGNDFVIYPPFVNKIPKIDLTKGCFLHETNQFYLLDKTSLYYFEIIFMS